jgi:hypothetical protein
MMRMQRNWWLIFLKNSFSYHNYHANFHSKEAKKIVDHFVNCLKMSLISIRLPRITEHWWIFAVGYSTERQSKANIFIELTIILNAFTLSLREKYIWLARINKMSKMMNKKTKWRNLHLYNQTLKYYHKHSFIQLQYLCW